MTPERSNLSKIEQHPITLRDKVQERMREAIIQGHFQPGERLVERPLCEQLGVSRTVIRETIRYLEAEGLVEILPNRGPIVAKMNWDDAKQIYEIRKQLETSAAVACAKNHSNETQDKLKSSLNALELAFKDGGTATLFQATAQFYQVIFEEAGHHIALEIVQRLNGRISRLRVMTLSTNDRFQSGFAHMTAICEAILSRDPKAAKRAVETHIHDAAQIAKRLLADEDMGV
ncbi:GntR family transcriptional regulator [Amylibacter sp. SFDW26]|nr:GntR family transcriptional regulator [Amylibacter sp. SFDW26]